jgi:hypothetical protein
MWLLLVRLLVRLVHHGESGDRPSGNQNWLPPSPYSLLDGPFFYLAYKSTVFNGLLLFIWGAFRTT